MALIEAAANGHLGIVNVLLSYGADARQRQADGTRALDWAAQRGHQGIVERLLAHDPKLLDLPGYHERTALAAAAGNGHREIVALLLRRGADPRRRLDEGTRALDWAAGAGHDEVVTLLLAHDPGLLDLPGGRDRTALMVAAAAGHGGLVELLHERGADLTRQGADGETVLDGVVSNERWKVLERILELAPQLWDVPLVIDASATGGDQLAPGVQLSGNGRLLDVLIVRRHVAVVRNLLERHKSRIDAPGVHGATPLMLCTATAQDELVRWLLGNGADAARCDKSGDHALLYALEQRAVECARLLIAHDPRLMYRAGARGRRPVTVVAGMSRSPQLRELFAKHGAWLASSG
jgi:serine/threonine-protein phosphatase 6 regulatory ankyrin repeat subunit B